MLLLRQTLRFLKYIASIFHKFYVQFVFFSSGWPIRCRTIRLDHYARTVHSKIIITFEFCYQGSIHEHLFLYHFHRWFVVVTTDVITLVYLCHSRTFFKLRACLALCFSLVGSAVFGDKMGILVEEAVENGPTTFTAFVQVIAIHNLLWRQLLQFRCLFCIFQLHPRLDRLNIAHCEAGTALSLIT